MSRYKDANRISTPHFAPGRGRRDFEIENREDVRGHEFQFFRPREIIAMNLLSCTLRTTKILASEIYTPVVRVQKIHVFAFVESSILMYQLHLLARVQAVFPSRRYAAFERRS